MEAILNVVLPVFAIVLAGYLTGRFRLLGEASSQALNGFVYYAALPALFFVSMARVPIAAIFDARFLGAYVGGLAATAAVAVGVARFAFPNRLAGLGLHGLAATFANTGYMGIPLLVTAFGPAAALPAIIATVVNGAVVMAAGIAIVEWDLARGGGPLRILADVARGVARSPLVLAALAGILASASGWTPPAPLLTFCDILGAAAPPCALFAMGLFLVGRSVTAGKAELGWLAAMKLGLQPALTWLLVGWLALDPLRAESAVLLAALPTGTLVFVLAQQYGIYVQRATGAILLSTVLSVATLSALLGVMRG